MHCIFSNHIIQLFLKPVNFIEYSLQKSDYHSTVAVFQAQFKIQSSNRVTFYLLNRSHKQHIYKFNGIILLRYLPEIPNRKINIINIRFKFEFLFFWILLELGNRQTDAIKNSFAVQPNFLIRISTKICKRTTDLINSCFDNFMDVSYKISTRISNRRKNAINNSFINLVDYIYLDIQQNFQKVNRNHKHQLFFNLAELFCSYNYEYY